MYKTFCFISFRTLTNNRPQTRSWPRGWPAIFMMRPDPRARPEYSIELVNTRSLRSRTSSFATAPCRLYRQGFRELYFIASMKMGKAGPDDVAPKRGNSPEAFLAAASQHRCRVHLHAPVAGICMASARRGAGLCIHQFDISQMHRETGRRVPQDRFRVAQVHLDIIAC